MSLNIEMLEGARLVGRKIVARCLACAEEGRDRKCEHLVVMDGGEGPYRCIVDGDGPGGAHSRRIFALVGRKSDAIKPLPRRSFASVLAEPDTMPALPTLHPLTAEHMETFCRDRRWNCYGGLGEGARRGFLHYCEVWDRWELAPTLLITDSSRRNVEMRRLDGSPWTDIGKKVKTLAGEGHLRREIAQFVGLGVAPHRAGDHQRRGDGAREDPVAILRLSGGRHDLQGRVELDVGEVGFQRHAHGR